MFRFNAFEKTRSPEANGFSDDRMQVIRNKKGFLYREGDLLDRAFLLLKGSVALSKRHSCGRKVHLKNCHPGYYLGLHRCTDNLMSHSARVSRDCALLSIPLSRLTLIQVDMNQQESLIGQIIQDIDYFYSLAFSD